VFGGGLGVVIPDLSLLAAELLQPACQASRFAEEKASPVARLHQCLLDAVRRACLADASCLPCRPSSDCHACGYVVPGGGAVGPPGRAVASGCGALATPLYLYLAASETIPDDDHLDLNGEST